MTYHHQHLHYLVSQHDEERWDCAATLALLTVSTTVHRVIAPSPPTTAMAGGGRPSASGARPSLSVKRTTTVDRLTELARERKDLSKMVSAETQRFNAFYTHTQARVLANKKAYIKELHQHQHHRQACNETKLHRSKGREVNYQKQQQQQQQQQRRSASRRDEAATKDRQSSTSSSTPALCESADDEASQQTGSTTPRALLTVASESRKRKRRGGQPLRACGEDDSGVEEDEEEALLVAEGPDDSEGDLEEEQDEEYQDQDDDDDWTASKKQSSRGREEMRELINKPSSPVVLGARRRTKRTKFDDNWDKRFAQLVTYFTEFGNALIPQKWRENPTLGKWASNQRYLLAKQRLDPSRYDRLDQLGFWDTKFSSTSRAKANNF